MEYNKEKVEAAKILFAEVLELNQQLPKERDIEMRIWGMENPKVDVIFWHTDSNGTYDYADEDHFEVYLTDEDWHRSFESSFADITAKMQEWKELYCN